MKIFNKIGEFLWSLIMMFFIGTALYGGFYFDLNMVVVSLLMIAFSMFVLHGFMFNET